MAVMRLVGFAAVVLVGLVVTGAATGVLLAALDVIPLAEEVFTLAPRGLVGLAAVGFGLAGLGVATAVLPLPRTRQVLGGAAFLALLTALALGLTWLTVYAGARVYVRVAGVRVVLPAELNEDRVLLGSLALLFAMLTAAAWVATIRLVWRFLAGRPLS